MSHAPNLGAPIPSHPDTRFYLVVSPKGITPIRATLLSSTFTGFWTHWNERPIPCADNPSCRYCQMGMGHRWTGYIAAYSQTHSKDVVLALTEGAARQLLKLDPEGKGLRGMDVTLRRATLKPNCPVTVHLNGKHDGEGKKAEFDVVPSLYRLWGLNEHFVGRGKPRPASRPDLNPDDKRTIHRVMVDRASDPKDDVW